VAGRVDASAGSAIAASARADAEPHEFVDDACLLGHLAPRGVLQVLADLDGAGEERI
jgi:hypothetical protein